MKQKNIIIALVVLVGIILLFNYSDWRHGNWGMMGDEEMYEEMEEYMHDEDGMLEEMEEHMDIGDKGSFDEVDTQIPTSADNAPEGSMHNLPVPEAVAAVRAQVATELGISQGVVIVLSAYEQEWPNGCLGLAGADEMCTEALVPGYEVTVLAQGNERVFRTNADGSVIREEK